MAAVLPLARSPLVSSALVVGSMSPDVPYYARIYVDAGTTHSLLGVVGVDALIGAALSVLWHAVLVGPAHACAPQGLRARVPRTALRPVTSRLGSPRELLLTYVSLCIGAGTHVCWDAFTHAGRWGTTHVTWLQQAHHGVVGFEWAQYGSGLFGAAAVAVWLARWWRASPVDALADGGLGRDAGLAWACIAIVGATSAAAVLLSPSDVDTTRGVAFKAVTRSIGMAAAVALVLAMAWQVSQWWSQRSARAQDP